MHFNKYYIIAGEVSGDMHAANLVNAMKELDSNIEFRGFGGELMQNAGVKISRGLDKLSLVGFIEIIKHLGTINENFRIAKREIVEFNPTAIILIDYPGFNLRMAEWAKSKGIIVYFYVAPQVWAWGKKRIVKMKKFIDKLFVILPFEQEFFRQNGLDVEYVGNPLIQEIDRFEMEDDFLVNHNIPVNKKIVAFLPGSRESEIKRNIKSVIPVIKNNLDKYFLVAARTGLDTSHFEELESLDNVKIIFDDSYKIFNVSDAGIIKSGTSTLEAALFELPQVVVYKVNYLSYLIVKNLVKDLKFVSLINLIFNRKVVTELLQHDFNPDLLEKELNLLFDPNKRKDMLTDYQKLKGILKKEKYASQIVAESIIAAQEINI